MNQLLLLCLIAGRRAAIPTARVLSVIEIEAITPIPMTADFILGLTALRSQALTVIDCRVALGFDGTEGVIGRRAAVVEHESHRYALLVDEAFDVAAAQSDPAPVPGGFGAGWRQAATGMVETESGPALLIDVEQLILGPRRIAAAA
ncbi:chemotaxis protein CheW [Qipengyuania sediminis]|uniref:chemotaxis protein CheW n=1 Tax=Qipengyuania sediminis TaxID=1532023 RepID=UPI0010597F05|nr:chemotaxis protein CheW [Qipengyuania sediminis]